jgi:hypothetical protein
VDQSKQNGTSTASSSTIVSDINEMLERYGPTFVDLAVGKRSDMEALLEFYGAPLRFIGPTFHMVMKDNAAIIGPTGMGGEIDRLQQANFAESALDRCDINVLNDRAALVDALWLRRNNQGALMARFAVTYLVALTEEGWRITSAVNTEEGTSTSKRNNKTKEDRRKQ